MIIIQNLQSESKIRAKLFAVGISAVAFGMTAVYVLGNLMPWRDTTLIYAAIIFGAFSTGFLVRIQLSIQTIRKYRKPFFQIPETPQWLLSRDRPADAMKSLQWLRGWVQPIDVQTEFNYLQYHKTVTYVCHECEKQSTPCNHPPPKIMDRFRDFFRRKTLVPFVIVSSQFFISAFLESAFRPYFVQILHDFESSIDPNLALPWFGYAGFIGNVALIFAVRPLGKRKIYLVSLATAILIYFAIGNKFGKIAFSEKKKKYVSNLIDLFRYLCL